MVFSSITSKKPRKSKQSKLERLDLDLVEPTHFRNGIGETLFDVSELLTQLRSQNPSASMAYSRLPLALACRNCRIASTRRFSYQNHRSYSRERLRAEVSSCG